MNVKKDLKTGKWEAQFYFTDWKGKSTKKHKRGFATKKEAIAWVNEFLMTNEARGKQLEQRVKDEERRRRNHFMIKAGAEVQSVLGRKLEEGDAERLRSFLDKQEMNGHFFTKAMNRDRVIREGDPGDTVCENPLT